MQCGGGPCATAGRRFAARWCALEIIDTTEMERADLQRKYIDAIMPSVFKKYRVRQVFGSRRRAGWLFGRGVPALVVLGPNSSPMPEDLYPREERGTLVTIWDFLASLGESKEKAKNSNRRKRFKRSLAFENEASSVIQSFWQLNFRTPFYNLMIRCFFLRPHGAADV